MSDIAPIFFALTPWFAALVAYNVRLPKYVDRIHSFFYTFYLSCATLCMAAIVTHVKYPGGVLLPGFAKAITVPQLAITFLLICIICLLVFFAMVNHENAKTYIANGHRAYKIVFTILAGVTYLSLLGSLILPMVFGITGGNP